MSIIIRLNASSLRPKSMFRLPMDSQLVVSSEGVGAQPLLAMKTIVRTKPVTIAPMDRSALVVRQRRVKSVITAAESIGRNKIIQGSACKFIRLKTHYRKMSVAPASRGLFRASRPKPGVGAACRCLVDSERSRVRRRNLAGRQIEPAGGGCYPQLLMNRFSFV